MRLSERAAAWRWVLGEILIVVVGVLIALAVDGWRESRRDDRTEAQYLSSIVEDLDNDFAELGRAGVQAEASAAAARTVLGVLSGQARSLPGDSLAYAVEYAGFLYFPAYFPYTFNELVSTGNLRIIRDSQLRREIAAYYNLIESEKQWWDRYRGIQERYTRAMQGILGPDIRGQITSGRLLQVSEEDHLRILRELSARADLTGSLEGMIWLQDRQIRWHAVNRRRGEHLRALITATLDDQGPG